MSVDMRTDIRFLKGVGQKRAALFAKLGIFTVEDLLQFYPRHYENWTDIVPIAEAQNDVNVCVKGTVASNLRVMHKRPGLDIYSVEVTDGRDIIEVTYFNSKYFAENLKLGQEYIFFGKIKFTPTLPGYMPRRFMNNPQYVRAQDSKNTLTPIYHQTEGLSTKIIEKTIKSALTELGETVDPLPERIVKQKNMLSLTQALNNIHFPADENMLARAKKRLVYEDLFCLQVGLLRLKAKSKKQTSCVLKYDYSDEFFSLLPFTPTNAQKSAVKDAVADMRSGVPMNRLLQGDVGSGKTCVAAALIYCCIKNGRQAALMAPTEVLAQQHFKTMCGFFEGCGFDIELLTGSLTASEKKRIKKKLLDGECDLVIGTHSLIQKDVEIKNSGLVITDEQHRFGVKQRGDLAKTGDNPHTLVMSATPIPRTLSFIIFGDLDLSILDELPKGRQKIETYLVSSSLRERAYGYVKKHLLEGKQGYIVCPLVDDNDDEDSSFNELKSATERFKELSEGYFRDFRLGLLYGKMKPKDKKTVMESFSNGETDLLISTTVIEVGVDVPNAVIMVIENAERFGLSTLHQLRGRIGRGKDKSTCIMISDNQSGETGERLKIMTETTDGFKIADEDLRLRGPGDFFGMRQHGLPDIKIANMLSDSAVIRESNVDAVNLLKENPELKGEEYLPLKSRVNKMFSSGITMN